MDCCVRITISLTVYSMVIFSHRYFDSDSINFQNFVFLAVHWSIWTSLYNTDIKVQQFWNRASTMLTLSRPISLHSRKPPGPHCFEPFTCNVYRSFQPHNMHMCKQFWGKVSTAKIFYDYQTYLWFVWYFPSKWTWTQNRRDFPTLES